jgi:hypothetical protein
MVTPGWAAAHGHEGVPFDPSAMVPEHPRLPGVGQIERKLAPSEHGSRAGVFRRSPRARTPGLTR